MIRYLLSGGDGAAYGPAFGPIEVEELALVDGVQERAALVVRSIQPESIDGSEALFLLVTPRYKGETVETIRARECIVNVARVICGAEEDPVDAVRRSAVGSLSIGSIQRLET